MAEKSVKPLEIKLVEDTNGLPSISLENQGKLKKGAVLSIRNKRELIDDIKSNEYNLIDTVYTIARGDTSQKISLRKYVLYDARSFNNDHAVILKIGEVIAEGLDENRNYDRRLKEVGL